MKEKVPFVTRPLLCPNQTHLQQKTCILPNQSPYIWALLSSAVQTNFLHIDTKKQCKLLLFLGRSYSQLDMPVNTYVDFVMFNWNCFHCFVASMVSVSSSDHNICRPFSSLIFWNHSESFDINKRHADIYNLNSETPFLTSFQKWNKHIHTVVTFTLDISGLSLINNHKNSPS